MIKVQVKRNHSSQELIVSGHAKFGLHGKDLVCAGVSCILFGGINALSKYQKGTEWFEIKGNLITIVIAQHNHETEIILETILFQLQTIEESFPENIKIIQEVWKC